MKAKVTWILIADGATAKVFEHTGPGKGLRAVDDLMFEQTPLKAGEIMAIMVVLQLPPRESPSMRVSFESR